MSTAPIASVVRKVGFWQLLCRILAVMVGKRRGDRGCIYIPGRIINRPDPCIYDQFLLMQLGLPVTWDNPDFAIMLGGVKQYTYGLTAGTAYDLAITIHNSSREKPALGTTVKVVWMEFGAGGTVTTLIGTVVTDVPVWPGTSVIHVPWTTPGTPGHYCLQAQISHPNDGNPANNLGQNNTQVYAAHSQVKGQIRIFNKFLGAPAITIIGNDRQTRPRNHVEITVDSYVFKDGSGKDLDPMTTFAPREPAWPAQVVPASFDFGPDEPYRDVTLIVDAPNGPGPAEVFNVTARQDGTPLGGVTVTVERK
jgi:hypothetical protein